MSDRNDSNAPDLEASGQSHESGQDSVSMGKSIIRSVWGLSLFAVITAGFIALTQVGTAERISEQIKQARSKALLEVVPLDAFDNDLLEDAFMLPATEALGLSEATEAFIAMQAGIPTHVILPLVAPQGYSGPIRLIMSISMAGEIQGVRVIEHKETPGLGDKIDIKKSDWVTQFEGKSLNNPKPENWKVQKDGGEFDQLTGATITPRAIVNAVYTALDYFQKHRDEVLSNRLSETIKTTNAPATP